MKRLLALLIGLSVTWAAIAHSQDGHRANFVRDMVSDPDLCETPGFVTKNHDIRGLVGLMNRQMLEMSTSASASINEILTEDRGRIDRYLVTLKAHQAQIIASAPSDHASTHVLYYCLVKLEAPPSVSNPIINQLLTKYTLMVGSLLKSTSANIPADLLQDDDERLTQNIADIESYLATVDGDGPQDYPRQKAVTDYIEETAGIARRPEPQQVR